MTQTVSAHETGMVRLYAVDIQAHEIRNFTANADDAPSPLTRALGISDLNPRYAQIIYVADLEGVGLESYLIEGEGLAAEDLAPHKAALENLTGHIAVISSRAFDGKAVTLQPKPPLRHVLTLGRPGPATTMEPLTAESAKGVAGAADAPGSAQPKRGDSAAIVIALIAIAIALVVIGLGI